MSATGDRRAGERGATLIEMLVVVAVMGLIAGLIYPEFTHALRASNLSVAEERLNADLRMARADAARGGHATEVELASDNRGYQTRRGPVRLASPMRIDADNSIIQFFGDGSSTGGRWTLVYGSRTLTTAVDPVSGVVTAAAAR